MLRTRVVALLLAVAVLLCVPTFSASAEEQTCKVSLSFVGSGSVTVNETEYTDDFTRYFTVGESVTMTAVADEGFEFLFWVNIETNRIISWDPTYTFYAASYALYEAVFDVLESDAAADDWHTVVYLTDGDNILYMQPVMLDDSSYFEDVSSINLSVSGKTWLGWDKTEDEVAATPERVYVHPVYSIDVSFTVTSIIDGETETYNVQYLSTLRLVAPTMLNGQKFSYWLAHAKDVNSVDEIASFYDEYQFTVTGNVTLEAIYGASYDLGIAARISGDLPSFNESVITIHSEHCLTRGFTVMEHGMLITKNLQIGSFPETFVINPNESSIYNRKSKDTSMAGRFSVDIGNWTAVTEGSYTYYPRIFARAYVKAKDSNGVTYTFYSAIYCVEYVLGTGSGGGDNNDDPFG